MASRFPLQLNSLRFYVNPTGLNIQKGLNYNTLATQGGVKYQVWYETPEILTITGDCAGDTAYKELVFLRQQYELTNKISELFYKTQLYRGFITSVQVDHSTQHLNRFSYTIVFQLLQGEKFAIEDFSLTDNETGIVSDTINRLENTINKRLGLNNIQTKIDNLFNKL